MYSVPNMQWVTDVASLHLENKDTKASVSSGEIHRSRRAEFLVKSWFKEHRSMPNDIALDLRVPGWSDTWDWEVMPNRWGIVREDTTKTYLLYSNGRKIETLGYDIDIPELGVDIKSGKSVRESELKKTLFVVQVPTLLTVNSRWSAEPLFTTREAITQAAEWNRNKGKAYWRYTYFNDEMNWRPLCDF